MGKDKGGGGYKKKVVQDPGLNPHTTAAMRKEVLTRPPPPHTQPHPHTQGRGQNRKIHWGIIFSPKMMILQEVQHPVPYFGVSYTNDPPQTGGA